MRKLTSFCCRATRRARDAEGQTNSGPRSHCYCCAAHCLLLSAQRLAATESTSSRQTVGRSTAASRFHFFSLFVERPFSSSAACCSHYCVPLKEVSREKPKVRHRRFLRLSAVGSSAHSRQTYFPPPEPRRMLNRSAKGKSANQQNCKMARTSPGRSHTPLISLLRMRGITG